MIELDNNLNFDRKKLAKFCSENLENKLFYNFHKNSLIVSERTEDNSIYIGFCCNLCKEEKIGIIKDFIIFNRNKILDKFVLDELKEMYKFNNYEKLEPTKKLKQLTDLEFNLHCNYVFDMYNKFILGNKKTEELTSLERILEDYIQILNIMKIKRSFK